MKKVLIGVVVVLVIIGGGIAYVFLNAGDIVKQVVEEVGSEATKADVTLSSVDLSIQSGEAALNGFQLGNPQGFKTPKAMSFGLVSVKIDTNTVTSDVIVINEVVIAKPEITYEFANNGSNFDAIQKNVDAYAKSMGAGGGKSDESAKSQGEKKVIIHNLYIRDGKVGGSALGQTIDVPLPDIHIKDIGKATNGALASDVAKSVLGAINRSVGKAVASIGLDKLMDKAKGATKMLEGGADGAKKMLEGGGGDAKKMLDGAAKGVGDSLKGMFGK